jgi:hypothetical protein
MGETWMRAGRVAVVAVIAVVLYVAVLPSSHADRSRLADLSIRDPHVSGLKTKPTTAMSVSAIKDTISTVKKAALRDPSETGVYEVEWEATAGSTISEAGLLVQVLPNVSDAVASIPVAVSVYGKTEPGQTLVSHFAVAGSQGSGNAYAVKGSSAGATGTLYTAIFRVDRAVVIELGESSSTTLDPMPEQTIATAEAALLASRMPSFSLVTTSRPVWAVVLVIVGGIVIAAGAYFLPEMAAERRVTRELRARERARSQYRSRGRGAVKRGQAPAWRQGQKR